MSAEAEVRGQKPNSISEFYYKTIGFPRAAIPDSLRVEGCDVEENGGREK